MEIKKTTKIIFTFILLISFILDSCIMSFDFRNRLIKAGDIAYTYDSRMSCMIVPAERQFTSWCYFFDFIDYRKNNVIVL